MMASFYRRFPKMSVMTGAFFVLFLVFLTYPKAFCAVYFDLGKLPTEVSYNGIIKKGNPAEIEDLRALLEAKHDEAIGHEQAHKRAYGPWGRESYIYYYTALGRDFALAGCTPFKIGTPLEILYKAALAPMEPTDSDVFMAKFFKSAIYAFDFSFGKALAEFGNALWLLLKSFGPIILVFTTFVFFAFYIMRSFL